LLISAKIIKARTPKKCSSCMFTIDPKSICWRLYGCAETGDKPYTIFLHKRCGDLYKESPGNEKMFKALKKYNNKYKTKHIKK